MMPRVPSKVPEGLLYGLTAFGLFAFGCVEPWSRSILEVLCFLLALASLLRGGAALPPAAESFWLFPAGLAALGVAQLGAAVPPDFPRPAGPFTTAPSSTSAAVVLWAAYACLLWSVPRVLAAHDAARRYCRVVFGLGAAFAAQGLLQLATGGNRLYWLRYTSDTLRPFGAYFNKDHAANVMLMAAAVGMGLFVSMIARAREREREIEPNALAWVGGASVLLLVGVLASRSRGALLALPLTAVVVALLGAGFSRRAKKRRLRAAAALAALAFVLLCAFVHVSSNADAGALIDGSVRDRLFIYADSWRFWRDAPLFGTGLGTFSSIYPSYQDLELRGFVQYAHSDWLQLALEAGLTGFLAALAAAVLAAYVGVRTWHRARFAETRALLGGVLAAAAAFCLHVLFEFSFQVPGNAVIFLGLVGLLLASPSWTDKAAARARPEPPRPWMGAIALVCCMLVSRVALRPAAAAWRAQAAGSPDRRAVGYARALALDYDPAHIKGLAKAFYDKAGSGLSTDVEALRAAMGYALASVELRPYDSSALYLAGASLMRLGRQHDADALARRAASIRFTPIARVKADSEPAPRSTRLEALRRLGIAPAAGSRR